MNIIVDIILPVTAATVWLFVGFVQGRALKRARRERDQAMEKNRLYLNTLKDRYRPRPPITNAEVMAAGPLFHGMLTAIAHNDAASMSKLFNAMSERERGAVCAFGVLYCDGVVRELVTGDMDDFLARSALRAAQEAERVRHD